MQRRTLIKQVALGGLLGNSVTAQPGPAPATVPAAALTTTPLVLMAPGTDNVTAIWGVSKLCKGRVEWEGPDGARGVATTDGFGMVPQGTRVIKVPVRGLQPGTEYRLRAITTSASTQSVETSEWKMLRTLDATAAKSHFVIWNDTHLNNPVIQQLHDLTPPADFLLWNGDTCNDWTTGEIMLPALLNPGERDITRGRPLMLVWGNHDVRGKWAYQLPDLVATPGGRPFYAFRSGPIAVICLHTGEDKPDDHPSFGGRVSFDTLRREQGNWLGQIIQRPDLRDAPYRVVFCHIPLRWIEEGAIDYKSGGYDHFSGRNRDAWHNHLVKWRAQIIISGHTHQPAWIPPTADFPYGQLVGGGPKQDNATWMEGIADATKLDIRMHDLAGKELHHVRIKPV